jgi:hypothetical protein
MRPRKTPFPPKAAPLVRVRLIDVEQTLFVLRWQFKTENGRRFWFEARTRARLRQLLEALNVHIPGGAFQLQAEDVIGRECLIREQDGITEFVEITIRTAVDFPETAKVARRAQKVA